MKKIYFILAAAATLFAACAETDVLVDLSEKENAPKAIGFETFANKTTRHTNVTTMNTYHTTFGVYGYNDANGLFMENYKVSYNNSAWGYNGLEGGTDGSTAQNTKYWNKLTNYDFYAYAPYTAGVSFANGNLVIPSGNYAATENLQATFSPEQNTSVFSTNIDWMKADPVNDYTHSIAATVPFTFSHMLSKLVVAVQTSGDESIKVTSLSIEGNTYQTGSYNGTVWAPSNDTELTGVVGDITVKDKPYYSMEYLLIPTSSAAPKLSITYQLNGQTYTQSNLPVNNITSFAANTCYTLTVTIGLEAIQFSATAGTWSPNTNGSVSIQ